MFQDEANKNCVKLKTERSVSLYKARPSKQQQRCWNDTALCVPGDKRHPHQPTHCAKRSGCSKESKEMDVQPSVQSFLVPNIPAGVSCTASLACLVSDTFQGTNRPSPIKPNIDGNTSSAGRVNDVIIVPETLGMDLNPIEGGEESGSDVKLIHPALRYYTSANDKRYSNVPDRIHLVVTSYADADNRHPDDCGNVNVMNTHLAKHSTIASQQQVDQENEEGMYRERKNKTSRSRSILLSDSDSAQNSQAVWGTDSVVFNSTRLVSDDRSVQQRGGISSLCIIGEGLPSSNLHSPVFTKHCREAVLNDQSPALFDEEACELDPDDEHVSLEASASESNRTPPQKHTSCTPQFAVTTSPVSPSLLKSTLTVAGLQLPLPMSSQTCTGTHSSQHSQDLVPMEKSNPITNAQFAALSTNGASKTLTRTGSSACLKRNETAGDLTSRGQVVESKPADLSETYTTKYVVSKMYWKAINSSHALEHPTPANRSN